MKTLVAELERLSRLVKTPAQVQSVLYDLEYNTRDSMKSALMVWKTKNAHCLEAVHLAAYLLEKRGFPPLALSLDSADNICHVVFPYRTYRGWGSVGLSKEPGLHGRAAQFRSIRELAISYYRPYVDDTGRLEGYALVNLDDSESDWRFSIKNVWKSEKFILKSRHLPIPLSERHYQNALADYRNGGHKRQVYWR